MISFYSDVSTMSLQELIHRKYVPHLSNFLLNFSLHHVKINCVFVANEILGSAAINVRDPHESKKKTKETRKALSAGNGAYDKRCMTSGCFVRSLL